MCGIVGYIGHRDAYPIIIKGLKRLEYRGYDSAGITLFDDTIIVVKTKKVPQSPFSQSTRVPKDEASVVLPAVPKEASKAYCVAV